MSNALQCNNYITDFLLINCLSPIFMATGIKTAGLAGGLLLPYKGMLLAGLKAL
jgi:hypothetical protein